MKIFQRAQRSLFGEILDWMLTPLLLLWPITLGLTWLVAENIATKPFDRGLDYSAQALVQLVKAQLPSSALILPPAARDILRADGVDEVYFQVADAQDQWLSGERDLPTPAPGMAVVADTTLFRDDQLRGVAIRVAYVWVSNPLTGEPMGLVQVAETLEKRSVLAAEIIKGVMLPQFAILPLSVLLVWLALVRGIAPLNRLEDRIRKRKPDDMSPLDDHAVPQEVAPLVASINDLLMRLKDSIATQKRFLADAAHQLKTPLAGLRMQADLALREGASTQELKQSLQQIGRASVRATHTVNQLLSLARAEGSGAVLIMQPCNLVALAQQVVQDTLPLALERHLDLGYEGLAVNDPAAQTWGQATLVQELIRNLVDNAIRYTPSHADQPGVVTVRVLQHAQGPWLQVEDSGPGIAPAERELVFKPFYRVLDTEPEGSGLGLSIVQEIAIKLGATVVVQDAVPSRTPPGTQFTVRFVPMQS